MSDASNSQMLKRISAYILFFFLLAPRVLSQQGTGSIKGIVSDQLGGLVVAATVIATAANGKEKTFTTKSDGSYEFRSLAAGNYDLKVIATGFNVLEAKNVEVRSGKTLNLDLQLTIGTLEQTVMIDNKGVSTDADRNADATILRERELEALPNEPEALAAALQAMAGPTQGENGPQVKVSPVAIRKPASIKATSAFTFRTSGRCGRTSRFHRACVTKTRTTSTAILISRRA